VLLYTLLPASLLFLGVLIVAGVLAAAAIRKTKMERRLKLVTAAPSPAAAPAGTPAQPRAPAAGQAKRASANLHKRIRRLFTAGAARTWGMQSGAVKLVAAALVLGPAAGLIVNRGAGFSWWMAALGGGLAAYLGPRMLLLWEQGSAERQFRDQFPDTLDSIVRMLRAGLPMTAAVQTAGTEGVPPVSIVFNMIGDQVKIGIPIEEALDTSSRQLGLDDFRFFAVTVMLQYSTGGNIAQTFDMLSAIIRKRRATRMKARAATAEIRLTAYVLGSLPFLTVGLLMLLQPGYLAPLFGDPRGHVILLLAAGGLLLSFLVMRQMMRSVTKA